MDGFCTTPCIFLPSVSKKRILLSMQLLSKKFLVSAVKLQHKRKAKPSFFECAKKNIIRTKKGVANNLSRSVDVIAYDI